jgi:hypothetical protein
MANTAKRKRDVAHVVEAEGFEVIDVQTGKHMKVTASYRGHTKTFVVALTPNGGCRAEANFKAFVKRTRREIDALSQERKTA